MKLHIIQKMCFKSTFIINDLILEAILKNKAKEKNKLFSFKFIIFLFSKAYFCYYLDVLFKFDISIETN